MDVFKVLVRLKAQSGLSAFGGTEAEAARRGRGDGDGGAAARFAEHL